MSDVIAFPTVPHPKPADEPAMAAAPAVSRAEHARQKLLDEAAFGVAEKLALGAKLVALEKAAAELRALGNFKGPADYDRHNAEAYRAEVTYLETVIAAAEKHGVHGYWKTALATLPRPKSAAEWATGRGKW